MLGLATPFKTQNYGTKLQAYAMQSIFTEMGYDIINFTYTSSKKDKLATLFSPKKLAAKIKYKKSQKGTAGNAEYSKCMAQRNAGFDNFVNQNLRITRNFLSLAALKEYSKRYDAVICGSDKIGCLFIFNSSITRFLSFQRELAELRMRRVLAYARLRKPMKAFINQLSTALTAFPAER